MATRRAIEGLAGGHNLRRWFLPNMLWPRVYCPSHSRLDHSGGSQDRLHHAGKPLGEWTLRKLQREVEGWAPQRRVLLFIAGGKDRDRKLVQGLQYEKATFITGLSATSSGNLHAAAPVCATQTSSAGRLRLGKQSCLKLTFNWTTFWGQITFSASLDTINSRNLWNYSVAVCRFTPIRSAAVCAVAPAINWQIRSSWTRSGSWLLRLRATIRFREFFSAI